MRVWILSLSVLCMSACASARRGEPVAGPVELSAEARKGQLVFMRYCNQCHPNGEAGIGAAINNKKIPHPIMKLQIRNGVLGSMPRFPDNVISDADVERILAFTDALERHAD